MHRQLFARRILPLVALLLSCEASTPPVVPDDGKAHARATAPSKRSPAWSEIDKLVDEQKLEEAWQKIAPILAAGRAANDDAEIARALIARAQLRIALGGYETAVRDLRAEKWPTATVPHVEVELFYGRALVSYLEQYSWEINQREKVDTKGEVDLKKWTRGDIVAEAERAFQDVWSRRADLGGEPVTALGEYVRPNDYPDHVRDTLRDAVTYFSVQLLGDTSLWAPGESNGLYRLDLGKLADGTLAAPRLDDAARHPLERLCAALSDLEQWHRSQGDAGRAGALEARLERLRRLYDSFDGKSDRERLRKSLETVAAGYRAIPWWAMAQVLDAEWVSSSGDLVEARRIAQAAHDAYPDSVGGKHAAFIVARIEQPEFTVESMTSDRGKQRSISVMHKNLAKVYFRAYQVGLVERVRTADDYNLLPSYQDQKNLLEHAGTPAAEWEVALPATPDYQMHRTFVTPPLDAHGLYVLLASAQPGFPATGANRVEAVDFILTDLVVLSRTDGAGPLDVTVLDGASGKPVAGADVDLYQYDWQRKHTLVETRKSDGNGEARFSGGGPRSGHSYFVLARRGDDATVDTQYLYFNQPQPPREVTSTLVYTDRSIYRPEQTLDWKVVAYRGVRDAAKWSVLPKQALTVTLHDANGQEVAKAQVTTNTYGSAAGQFRLPAGRLLGQWSVRSSLGGAASVRVEEYKRPTFEVAIKDPTAPLRLNQKAALVGEAKYYFGLPVTSGQVKWRVERRAVYPYWWYWFNPPGGSSTEMVATGTATLAADGTFPVEFTPAADERLAKTPSGRALSYSYTISADLTDEGGETRSAERSFRLGFVSVEATISSEVGFYRAGQHVALDVHRASLDGVPRAGKGSWRLLALAQPDHALLPSEMPLPTAPDADAKAFKTPGDSLRPRWNTDYSPDAATAQWGDGPERAHGELTHGSDGKAALDLGALAPGAYRLRYTTVDDFGATAEAWRDLVVAAPVGQAAPLALPLVFSLEKSSVTVGDTARLFLRSGLPDQTLLLDRFRDGHLVERRRIAAREAGVVEIPIREADRGGFAFTLWTLRDDQLLSLSQSVYVPWDDRELTVELSTFRDKLRPGAKETFRVTVKAPQGRGKPARPVEQGAAELLAYMYDRSLDVFAAHSPPSTSGLYPSHTGIGWARPSLGSSGAYNLCCDGWGHLPDVPALDGDQLVFLDGYGIGGPGVRARRNYMRISGGATNMPPPPPSAAPAPAEPATADVTVEKKAPEKPAEAGRLGRGEGGKDEDQRDKNEAKANGDTTTQVRSNFSETAFWQPSLITDKQGSASIEFTVPDSVTSWNVWVHALTRDLRGGSTHKETRSVKDLMVRPYLPRFLREGDRADLKVVVNNASDHELSGSLDFEILDAVTQKSVASSFELKQSKASFTVKPGGGADLTFPVVAPRHVGVVAFRVVAHAGDLSDGELRPLPVLPSRMHLSQSRFVTLQGDAKRTMSFPDLAKAPKDDPSLVSEQLVVTVDAQLFYTVLKALPYLVEYPYECTEQTLNRFVSTGIVSSLYAQYPAVAKMAQDFSTRKTRLESFDREDPNRRMTLEESPWLEASRGNDTDLGLINVLDQNVARAQRDESLARLQKMQTSAGGFPWFPGGPPNPYMTLYLLSGFAKAAEFKVEVPKPMVVRAWQYLHRHYLDEIVPEMMNKDVGWEFITFLNYVIGNYPDTSWTGGVFTEIERKQMLDFSFKHWKQHSPELKGLLAVTLHRMSRDADAKLVWDSVMDSAKTVEDQGTFWAPEDRSWLWYNDTTETQAYALRTLMELRPDDARRHGLVLWLLLDKKLNHWKSTRATAEVIYSLVKYLEKEGALGVREEATVTVGPQKTTFTFEPDKYVGKAQLVIAGPQIDPARDSTITVEKHDKGTMFASANWQFSTDKLPAEDRGDFFAVSRRYFRRQNDGKEFTLTPLSDGTKLAPGDEIEVQISLRTKHEAEYVHLRDPRAAGLEPEDQTSRYEYQTGLAYYREVRDSGANFFFDWLPVGEYTFKYRLRASLGGTFRVGPATVQSLYAPEFNAYSAGNVITIGK